MARQRRLYNRTKWVAGIAQRSGYDELKESAEEFYKQPQFCCFELRASVTEDSKLERNSVSEIICNQRRRLARV